MVQVLVDFLSLPVLAKHTAKDAHAALPDELEGEASVRCTPPLTRTSVPSLPAHRAGSTLQIERSTHKKDPSKISIIYICYKASQKDDTRRATLE